MIIFCVCLTVCLTGRSRGLRVISQSERGWWRAPTNHVTQIRSTDNDWGDTRQSQASDKNFSSGDAVVIVLKYHQLVQLSIGCILSLTRKGCVRLCVCPVLSHDNSIDVTDLNICIPLICQILKLTYRFIFRNWLKISPLSVISGLSKITDWFEQ